jgi:hypothetical protein
MNAPAESSRGALRSAQTLRHPSGMDDEGCCSGSLVFIGITTARKSYRRICAGSHREKIFPFPYAIPCAIPSTFSCKSP